MKIATLILCGLLTVSAQTARAAQTSASAKNQEVVLTSEGGLEWDSNKKTLTADTKALVVRGDTALGADKIVAYYNDNGGKQDIYRVKAFGHVVITTDKQIVYADSATYEIADSVVVLKGNPVKLIAGDEKMTAKVVELWQEKGIAVAKNNVVAQKDARKLEADTVRAYFVSNAKKATEIERFEAENNVVISNEREKVEGDYGVYWVKKETATLEGGVKISQGNNFIMGEVADINMKTGVSRLQTPSEKGKSKKQVHGVFVPDSAKTKKAQEHGFEKPHKPDVLKDEKRENGSERTEKLLGSSDEKGE